MGRKFEKSGWLDSRYAFGLLLNVLLAYSLSSRDLDASTSTWGVVFIVTQTVLFSFLYSSTPSHPHPSVDHSYLPSSDSVYIVALSALFFSLTSLFGGKPVLILSNATLLQAALKLAWWHFVYALATSRDGDSAFATQCLLSVVIAVFSLRSPGLAGSIPVVWGISSAVWSLYGSQPESTCSSVTRNHAFRYSLLIAVLLCALAASCLLPTHVKDKVIPNKSLANSIASKDSTISISNGLFKEKPHSLTIHPIAARIEAAEGKWKELTLRQSNTLEEAVKSYRQRYGRYPPPGFDRWFEVAMKNKVKIIDGWDILTKSFEPFWKTSPAVLREMTKEASKQHQFGVDLAIHAGVLTNASANTPLYGQITELKRQMESYEEIIPELDLWLTNRLDVIDTNRVILPYDMRDVQQSDGHFQTGDFVWYDLTDRPPWDQVKVACGPDSAARQEVSTNQQPPSRYGNISFVSDLVETQSICDNPSLKRLHPTLWSSGKHVITYNHLPIFSVARTSLYSDILMPSPYYNMHENFTNITASESSFDSKLGQVYWTGSTTGGRINGDWHRGVSQRLRMVEYLKALAGPQPVTLLGKDEETNTWLADNEMTTGDMRSDYDVKFTRIAQLKDESQRAPIIEYFNITAGSKEPKIAVEKYKFLLDMDGNGFSGRFYRLLASNAVVLKQTLFQETHDDFLIPWYHYVPLTMEGTEIHEIVRYLRDEEEGRAAARLMAERARDWIKNYGRREDTGAGLARALLEYKRLISDDRATQRCCE